MPLPLTVIQEKEKPETVILTPQEADQQSFAGHMPDPETVTTTTTLDRAKKMGLYTEAGAENPEPLSVAEEVSEQQTAHDQSKPVDAQSHHTNSHGYTQTRTIATLALIGVIVLAVGLAVSMAGDDKDTSGQEVSPSPSVLTTVLSPTPSSDPSSTPAADQTDESTTPSESEAKLAKIVDNPDEYMSQQVTVTGEVNTVYTDRAFLLDGPGLINDTMLVVSKTAYKQEMLEDQQVRMDGKLTVTGTVQRFDRVSLGDALGVLLPENQYDQFEEQAYILINSVEIN